MKTPYNPYRRSVPAIPASKQSGKETEHSVSHWLMMACCVAMVAGVGLIVTRNRLESCTEVTVNPVKVNLTATDAVSGVVGGGRPPLEVAGSTAVVTGAAGGMGEHLAKGLARRGADLVVLDRDAAGLERVVAEIGRETPGARVTPFVVDLSDRAAADEVIVRIRDEHAGVTMLFNNAGVALYVGTAIVDRCVGIEI